LVFVRGKMDAIENSHGKKRGKATRLQPGYSRGRGDDGIAAREATHLAAGGGRAAYEGCPEAFEIRRRKQGQQGVPAQASEYKEEEPETAALK